MEQSDQKILHHWPQLGQNRKDQALERGQNCSKKLSNGYCRDDRYSETVQAKAVRGRTAKTLGRKISVAVKSRPANQIAE